MNFTTINSLKYVDSYKLYGRGVSVKVVNVLCIKRNMFTRAARGINQVIMYGKPLLSRNECTWINYAREATKGIPHIAIDKLPIHPETGLRILDTFDRSGSMHDILCDLNRKIPGGYVIGYGIWSSSPHPYNGKLPILVSKRLLDGSYQNQYFHEFDKPMLVNLATVQFSPYSMFLCLPEYENLLSMLRKKYNLGD